MTARDAPANRMRSAPVPAPDGGGTPHADRVTRVYYEGRWLMVHLHTAGEEYRKNLYAAMRGTLTPPEEVPAVYEFDGRILAYYPQLRRPLTEYQHRRLRRRITEAVEEVLRHDGPPELLSG